MEKIVLVLTVVSCFGGIQSQTWNYDRFDNWPLECRLGKSQSPIAIDSGYVVNQPMPLFDFIKYDIPLVATIQNTGASVEIKFEDNPDQPSIRGSILQSEYTLDNIHFHWPGEHTINGRRYSVEAHFVHYKTKAGSLETALNFKDGIVVIAVMYEISDVVNEALGDITDNVDEIAHQVGQPFQLQFPIIPSSFLPTNTDSYFTYRGSLTTPNCDESVLWFVFPHHAPMSQTQFDDLTDIYTRDDKPLVTNSRPLQNINGREILFTAGIHHHHHHRH